MAILAMRTAKMAVPRQQELHMLAQTAVQSEAGTLPLKERCYASLYRIRRVEEEIARVYPTDKIKSPVHLSIGQESVSVGVCEALRATDVVFGTYRSHALYLAKGGDLKQMIAELYGKDTGCARGKGGSMHLVDVPHGVMGASAVVASTIPNAVGYALAMQYMKRDAITVSFFGDGATEEGSFQESVNFALLKKVPIIFLCENNRYAIHSHQAARQPRDNLVERMRTCGMPAERLDGNDVIKLHDKISHAAANLRWQRSGPMFFECMTYRWREHVGPGTDWALGYRSEEECKHWMDNDPLLRMRRDLDTSKCERMEAEIEEEIRDAFNFAETSPFPAGSELYTDVFRE